MLVRRHTFAMINQDRNKWDGRITGKRSSQPVEKFSSPISKTIIEHF